MQIFDVRSVRFVCDIFHLEILIYDHFVSSIRLVILVCNPEYGRQKPSKVPFLNEIDKIEMN